MKVIKPGTLVSVDNNGRIKPIRSQLRCSMCGRFAKFSYPEGIEKSFCCNAVGKHMQSVPIGIVLACDENKGEVDIAINNICTYYQHNSLAIAGETICRYSL